MALVIIIEPEGEEEEEGGLQSSRRSQSKSSQFPGRRMENELFTRSNRSFFLYSKGGMDADNGSARWLKTLMFFSLSTIDQTGLSFSRRPSPSRTQTWQRCILIRALPRFVIASQPRIHIYKAGLFYTKQRPRKRTPN